MWGLHTLTGGGSGVAVTFFFQFVNKKGFVEGLPKRWKFC